MANSNPDTKGLKPLNKRTKKEQRLIAKKGGKKSGEARRKKKELIQISMFLHNFIDSQQDNVKEGLKKIVNNGGRDLLALVKEAREATEGSKSILMNPDGSELLSKGIKIAFEDTNNDSTDS